jgi:hypothetical protein
MVRKVTECVCARVCVCVCVCDGARSNNIPVTITIDKSLLTFRVADSLGHRRIWVKYTTRLRINVFTCLTLIRNLRAVKKGRKLEGKNETMNPDRLVS